MQGLEALVDGRHLDMAKAPSLPAKNTTGRLNVSSSVMGVPPANT